jgi:hypothetical protein
MKLLITISNSKANEFENKLKELQKYYEEKSKGNTTLIYDRNNNIFNIELTYIGSNWLSDKILFKALKDNIKKVDKNIEIKKI